MAKPKNVTINLTPKQREAIRSLTGEDHTAVVFEGNKKALTAKLAPRKHAPSVFNTNPLGGGAGGSVALSRVSTRKATRGIVKG